MTKVDQLIEDLTDRRGLRQEWEGIDEDIQNEIRETWRAIIEAPSLVEKRASEALEMLQKAGMGLPGQPNTLVDMVQELVTEIDRYENTPPTWAELSNLNDENDDLRKWIADLQAGQYVNCVYCGHRYGPEKDTPVTQAEILYAHITKCPKHPMSKIVRVGTATIIHHCKTNQVLMGLRKGEHGGGTWSFPGGHLDYGEEPSESASRELLEETGLLCGLIPHVPVPYLNTHFENGKQYITLFFVAHSILDEPPDIELKEPDKCERWGWFPPDDLPTPRFGAINDDILMASLQNLHPR